MDEMSETTNNESVTKQEINLPLMTLKEFLETVPLNSFCQVAGFYENGANYIWKNAPQLRIWCNDENCNGYRTFDGNWGDRDIGRSSENWDFLIYKCRDCGKFKKQFCIYYIVDKLGKGILIKLGELPERHIDIPSFLPKLLGPDYKYFVKGLKCEKQGCGIGAFSYYRRVLENQKGRILEQIIKVAKRIHADQSDIKNLEKAAQALHDETIKNLEDASNQIQFKTAVESFQSFIPQSLFIDGHNPMIVLHKALSIGLHESDDEICLQMAHSIRIILQDFSKRVKELLNEDNELKKAFSDVMNFNKLN
ncbi:MAG: hypothetical protein JSS81_06040 [Acidobacteria bacterium]|nr:hypothetical protein [Acidobacteriota bacterium]